MGKLLLVTALLVVAGAAFYFTCNKNCHKKADFSRFRADAYWGAGQIKAGQPFPKDSTEIRPFKVNFPDKDLQDLKSRLDKARYVDHIEDTQFNYGFNSQYLKQVVEYWRTKYDWRKEEAKLNAYEQFKTQIEGLDIHFFRVKPTKPAKTVLPLLVLHGWPGSVLEYYKSFALLTEPDKDGLAFEVIAPSIPGYGYSEAPHQKGFNVPATARIFSKLMQRLGHDKYMVHGGDWGSFITRTLAIVYPERVIGVHLLGNWDGISINSFTQFVKVMFADYFPSLFFGSENVERDYPKMFPLGEKFLNFLLETGYMHIQSTKPDTVGAALVDSPVGLAAYILEKFSTWTNAANKDKEDGGLTDKFTLDELLTNIMIYWTSGNIASSQRYYKENFPIDDDLSKSKILVPAGTVDYPNEMIRSPRLLIEHGYENLLQYSDFPTGGHFTAFEEPQLVSDDIRSLVRKIVAQQEQIKREQLEQAKKTKDEI